ncbi:MAG: hypothetical protein APF84_04445 [Gracilibacter sp. BRH_c7a]|nr:MAG: hypothetical protein APF84_04445 [Gracilibacter sp. BRH_c7a]
MVSIFDFDAQILTIIGLVISIIAVLALIMTMILYSRMKKFQKAYKSLQSFMSGIKMEDLLKANLKEVRELSQQGSSHDTRIEKIEEKLRCDVDRVELIRFNSFENMGADLSFALALLNQEGTGVILTGIHSIEESRVYCKAIEKGQAAVKLNKEEKDAIDKACKTIKV